MIEHSLDSPRRVLLAYFIKKRVSRSTVDTYVTGTGIVENLLSSTAGRKFFEESRNLLGLL